MNIDQNSAHLLRLIRKDQDSEGWTKVSKVVMPFIKECPEELREIIDQSDGGGKARLTDKGNTILDYL